MRLDEKILSQLSLSTSKTFVEIEQGLYTGIRSLALFSYDEFILSQRIHYQIEEGLVDKEAIDKELFGFLLTPNGYRVLQSKSSAYTGQALKVGFSPRG